MPHNAVSDQGPNCLLFILQFLDTHSEMLWTIYDVKIIHMVNTGVC